MEMEEQVSYIKTKILILVPQCGNCKQMNQLKENDEFNRENDDTSKDTSRLGMTNCHE